MRQRRQIAARSHRAFLGHHRNHVSLEHVHQQVQRGLANARVPASEDVGAQEHQRANLRHRKWRAGPGRVREDQVPLQLSQVRLRDRDFRQGAESGVDPVGGCVAGRDPVDESPGGPHPLASLGGDLDAGPSARHGAHLFQGEPVAGKNDAHEALLHHLSIRASVHDNVPRDAHRAEVRRHLGRGRRPHPQRCPPGAGRAQGRP